MAEWYAPVELRRIAQCSGRFEALALRLSTVVTASPSAVSRGERLRYSVESSRLRTCFAISALLIVTDGPRSPW